MDLNIDLALKIAQIAMLAASGGLSLYLFVRAADRRALEAISDQLPTMRAGAADMHTRLAVLETTVRHMPTHADLAGIQRELRELNSEVSALGERSETTLIAVRSIQGHLMETPR